MADFASKLNKLVVVEGPPRANLTELTDEAGYTILAARFHVHPTYGTSVIVDLMINGEKAMAFLPKRFGRTLNQQEVDTIGNGQYKLRVTGVTNKSPNVVIFKT